MNGVNRVLVKVIGKISAMPAFSAVLLCHNTIDTWRNCSDVSTG
jgi:hypothetical protein